MDTVKKQAQHWMAQGIRYVPGKRPRVVCRHPYNGSIKLRADSEAVLLYKIEKIMEEYYIREWRRRIQA